MIYREFQERFSYCAIEISHFVRFWKWEIHLHSCIMYVFGLSMTRYDLIEIINWILRKARRQTPEYDVRTAWRFLTNFDKFK